jgi:hypothetical protein
MATRILQNFYKTIITTACGIGTGNIYVATLPTSTTGYLVINPKDTTKREIIEYNLIGTDVGGSYVYANVRGVGGTTAQTHEVNEPVRMNYTAQHWLETMKIDTADNNFDAGMKKIKNVVDPISNQDACTKKYADELVVAGAPDASDSVKGITKLSVAAVVPTNPISVGDNDNRVPTQDENNALVGTSGTPSSTNRYITNDDVSNAGVADKVVRAVGTALPSLSGADLTNIPGTSQLFVLGENITALMAVYVNPTDGRIYRASSLNKDNLLYKYIGILKTTGLTGETKEVFVNGKVTIASLGLTNETIAETTIYDINHNSYLGMGSSAKPISQSFQTLADQDNISSIKVVLAKASTPNNLLTFNIYNVGLNGCETGASLMTKSFTESQLTTSPVEYELLSAPLSVSPAKKYIIVITHNSNNLNPPTIDWLLYINNIAGSQTVGGEFKWNNGGNHLLDENMCWDLLIKYTAKRNYYIGDYIYLNNAVGTYSKNSGTNYKKIGKILSSTEIMLEQHHNDELIGIGGLECVSSYDFVQMSYYPIPKNTRKIVLNVKSCTTIGYFQEQFTAYVKDFDVFRQTVRDRENTNLYIEVATCTFGTKGLILYTPGVPPDQINDIKLYYFN